MHLGALCGHLPQQDAFHDSTGIGRGAQEQQLVAAFQSGGHFAPGCWDLNIAGGVYSHAVDVNGQFQSAGPGCEKGCNTDCEQLQRVSSTCAAEADF
eukprot:5707777-Karenia_brevis.AAC.1